MARQKYVGSVSVYFESWAPALLELFYL